jgi:hypothetical protein
MGFGPGLAHELATRPVRADGRPDASASGPGAVVSGPYLLGSRPDASEHSTRVAVQVIGRVGQATGCSGHSS